MSMMPFNDTTIATDNEWTNTTADVLCWFFRRMSMKTQNL